MAPVFSPIIRPLAPLVAALNGARSALYKPPQSSISGVGEDLWPNPLQPVTPMGPPNAEPLQFPMDWGRNLIITPRGNELYSAAELRYLATYPLARICIENTKDMITRMPTKIQLKPLPGEDSKARAARTKGDPTLKALNKFFERPNPQQDWSQFLRPVLEDLLTIDAPAIFIGRDLKGKVSELRWLEGASITVLVEEHGWTPAPPSPAYQQNWQGYPRVDLTTDQLIYRPKNIVPRNTQDSFLYGMSPVEQMAQEIKIGIERLRFVYDFYKEGSIPGGMHFVPPGTNVDKIKEYQQFLDATYSGNLAGRRRLQLIQGWQKDGHPEQLAFPKEPTLADAFDDLHIRKICFAFGTSPQRLMRMINRSSAETAQTSAEEEGTMPWMEWLKSTVDYIIQVVLGHEEYEFTYDPFHELDQLKQAQADLIDVDNGMYSVNEIRVRRGDDPRPEPAAEQLNIKTAQGTVKLGEQVKPPPSAGGFGNKVEKTNGHSTWTTCAKHTKSYPRSYCRGCVQAEMMRLEAEEQAQAEVF